MSDDEPCGVGRTINNERLSGWMDRCPEVATADVALPLAGVVLHFCPRHFAEFSREMGDVSEVVA